MASRVDRFVARLQQSGDATYTMLASVIQAQTAMLGSDADAVADVVNGLFQEWQLTEDPED